MATAKLEKRLQELQSELAKEERELQSRTSSLKHHIDIIEDPRGVHFDLGFSHRYIIQYRKEIEEISARIDKINKKN